MARSARNYQQEAKELRARGWTYREIARDWASRYGFNSRVAFRLAHGMTQADVAAKWNELWPDPERIKAGKHISYWEIWPEPGGRLPSVETLNRLAYLYQCAAGDLLDGEDYSHLDPAYRTEIRAGLDGTRAAASPSDVERLPAVPVARPALDSLSDRTVDDFELLTETYRRMDYRSGSQSVNSEVGRHLRRMLQLEGQAQNLAVGRHLTSAIGDAAQLAAWLSIDAQRYDEARAYCQLAMSMAAKNNDRSLHAYVLGVVGYTYLHAGNGAGALGVLPPASDLAGSAVAPAVRSWVAEARAEAHAYDGDPRAGLRELAEAERLFDPVTITNAPVWLGFFNAEHHAIRLKGRCLVRLGRSREASSTLTDVLNRLPPTFVRERSGTLIDLALAHLQMKEIEESCRVAAQAEILARQTRSERNLKRLRELLVELMPWTDLDCVKDLYRQTLIN